MSSENAQRLRFRRLSSCATSAGFTLIELLLVIAIISTLALLVLPNIRNARGPARRAQCLNNMRNISLALLNYHSDYRAFPPARTVDAEGRPLHSWRTLILPYLDQGALFDSIDLSKPWNDPANAAALATTLEVYQCPSFSGAENLTTYAALVGEQSCFLPTGSRTLDEITDERSETLMLIEVSPELAVPWMVPEDSGMEFLLKRDLPSNSDHGHGVHVMFADGHGQFLSTRTSAEILQALSTVNGGEALSDL